MDVSQTLQTYCEHIEHVHVGSKLTSNSFLENYGILNLVILAEFLHYYILQFSIKVSQTLQTYHKQIEDEHMGFGLS